MDSWKRHTMPIVRGTGPDPDTHHRPHPLHYQQDTPHGETTMDPTTNAIIETARKLGTQDGQTQANEGREDGSYRKGGSADWDSGLINALGNSKVRKLFGLTGDLNPSEDAVYAEALKEYDAAATEAYDAD